jgi:hypothetical protein
MEIVNYDVTESNCKMSSVLRNGSLATIPTDANHKVASASTANFNLLPSVTVCHESLFDLFHALSALEYLEPLGGFCRNRKRIAGFHDNRPYPLLITSSKFRSKLAIIVHAANSLGFSFSSGFRSPTVMSCLAFSAACVYRAK